MRSRFEETEELETQPDRCRHCGSLYGDTTVLVCKVCRKSYEDPTPDEIKEQELGNPYRVLHLMP